MTHLVFKRTLFVGFLLAYAALASQAWATITLSGSAPRGGSVSSLTVSVVISGIAAEVTGDVRAQVETNFALFIANHTINNQAIAYEGGINTDRLPSYSATFSSDPSVSNDGANGFSISFALRINDNGGSPSIQDLLDEKKVIELTAKYTDPNGGTQDTLTPTKITKDIYVVNEAPEGVAMNTGHLSLNVSWAAKSSVAYNDKEGAVKKAPTGVKVVLIDTSIYQSYAFKAKTYNENADSESQDAVCDFLYLPGDPGSCTISNCRNTESGAAAYLDTSALADEVGIQVERAGAIQTSKDFSELELGTVYAAFAVYAPDGLINSSCVVGSVVRNFSLTEVNGASDAELVDPRCFIATAAYGTSQDQHVKLLRWFRDAFLMPTSLGRLLVRSYYRLSPPLAELIKDSPVLQKVTMAGLSPLVLAVTWFKWNTPLTALMMISFVWALFLAWRRHTLSRAA